MQQPVKFTPHFRFIGGDRLVLYLPFVSLAAVLAEITYKVATGLNPFSFLASNINDLFVNLILLNSLHLVFPFLILLLLPNGREFVRYKSVRWREHWLLGLAALFTVLLLFLVSLQSTKSMSLLEPLKPLIAGSMVWVWYLIPTFHGMRQSAGISQLMAVPEEDPKFQRAKKRERILLRFYYAGVMGLFAGQKWAGTPYQPILWVISAVTLGFAVAIILNTRKTSATGYRDKFIFSFRFLLWPLQPYSLIVLWSVVFNHGLEYLALIQHMLKTPGVESRTKRMFLAATLIGMGLISFYVIFNFIEPLWVSETWLVAVFFALYPFLTLLHYAIDGVAYRMSDPDVQKSMGRFFKVG